MFEYGAKIKFDWQVSPDRVKGVFWPADYEKTGKTERNLMADDCDQEGFMANLGSYIYEFTVTWTDHSMGCSGNATYYIHVIVERNG